MKGKEIWLLCCSILICSVAASNLLAHAKRGIPHLTTKNSKTAAQSKGAAAPRETQGNPTKTPQGHQWEFTGVCSSSPHTIVRLLAVATVWGQGTMSRLKFLRNEIWQRNLLSNTSLPKRRQAGVPALEDKTSFQIINVAHLHYHQYFQHPSAPKTNRQDIYNRHCGLQSDKAARPPAAHCQSASQQQACQQHVDSQAS